MTQTASVQTDMQYLPFEDKVAQIDCEIMDLQKLSEDTGKDRSSQIRKLQKAQTAELEGLYSNLTPWQTVQVARHRHRPILGDYLEMMIKDFKELHGDRYFGDDRTIITGFGKIGREKVLVVGQNKGRGTKEKIECNFGCANPEGYRKALAKMKLAEKFNIPVVTIIDTPAAFPGVSAEERGQARAIAVNLMEMARLKVPIICVCVGEGGSGGALGIGVGDQFAILEHAYYSVIPPEGCAAILWRDGTKAADASEALKLTSKELFRLKMVDKVIEEPLGGAHRNIHDTVYNVEQYIAKTLRKLKRLPLEKLLDSRYDKLRSIGTDHITRAAVKVTKERKTAEKPKIPERLSIEAQLKKAEEITPDKPTAAEAETVK